MSESFEAAPSGDQPNSSEAVAPDSSQQDVGSGETESFMDSPVPDNDPLAPRYKEMQAAFTRKTQSLAEQRKELEARAEQAEYWDRLQTDPEFQRQALEMLGYEVPDDEEYSEEYEYDEDPESLGEMPEDPRVAELWNAEQDRRIQQVALEVTDHIRDLETETGVELTERQRASIFRDSVLDGEPTPPRTQQVFNEFVEDVRAQQDSWQKNWLESKQGTPGIKGGEQGSESFDIGDKNARLQRMKAMIEAG